MVIMHIVFKQKNNYAISHNLKISVLRHPNLILFTLDCFFFICFSRRSRKYHLHPEVASVMFYTQVPDYG